MNEIFSEKCEEVSNLKELEGKLELLLKENEELNTVITETTKELECFRDKYADSEVKLDGFT